MKKTNNYKARIFRANTIAMIAFLLATTLFCILVIKFVPNEDIGIGYIFMSPLFGLIVASPMIIRQENIANHFKRLLKKEESKKAR